MDAKPTPKHDFAGAMPSAQMGVAAMRTVRCEGAAPAEHPVLFHVKTWLPVNVGNHRQ